MKKVILFITFVSFLMITLSSYQDGGLILNGNDGSGARGGGGCSCHAVEKDADINLVVELDSEGIALNHYVPGNVYKIAIRGRNNTQASLPKFGFRTTVVSSLAAGTNDALNSGIILSTPPNCENYKYGPYHYKVVSQKTALPATSVSGRSTYGTRYEVTIPWQAPPKGSGSVSIYAVLLAVNGDSTVKGDKWNKVVLSVDEAGIDYVITGKTNLCKNGTSVLSFPKGGGTWSSSDPDIIDVNSKTGQITGKTVGSSTITYSYNSDEFNSINSTIVANVLAVPVVSEIRGRENVCDNGATITLSNDAPGGKWSCQNTGNIFTISSNGILKGIKPGTDEVMYILENECGADYNTKKISVLSSPDPGLIVGDVTDICMGKQVQLRAYSPGGNWAVQNDKASITNDGLVTGREPGTDTVFYIIKNGFCEARAKKVLTFYPTPKLGGIFGPPTMKAGTSVQLSSNLQGGVWTINNNMAYISGDGTVNAISEGETIVSYTVTYGSCVSVDTHTITIEANGKK